jgi:hypothetical protein
MTWVLAALALAQGAATPGPTADDRPLLGPLIAAGASEEFIRACLTVEEKLEAGDFAAASALLARLPKPKFTMAWDDSGVPEGLRPSFAEARDRALQTWARSVPNFEVQVVPHRKDRPADLIVTFVPSIPARPGEAIPPAAAHFFSDDPAEPRLEAVLSLNRGSPAVPTEARDIHNEVAYAVVQYLGVGRSLSFGTFSGRTELPSSTLSLATTPDRLLATQNAAVVAQLARAIEKKQKVIPTRPSLHMDPVGFDGGQAKQGDQVRFNIQATNNGNAPLALKLQADCSCVHTLGASLLHPGETKLLPVLIDLTEVAGTLDKSIMIYSNDPEKVQYRMPVKVHSEPAYRFLFPDSAHVLMQKGGVTHRVILAVAEGVTLQPLAARFDGIEATVGFKPWSGELPDPVLNEPSKPRKGYELLIDVSDQIPPGRSSGTLHVLTDNETFKRIYTNLTVQFGIVALPEQVRLGDIPNAPRRGSFLVSRPKKGFKIVKVTSTSPHLSATVEAVKENWEYRIHVQFDGKAIPGHLDAVLTVHTDDPSQPKIDVPFQAWVK